MEPKISKLHQIPNYFEVKAFGQQYNAMDDSISRRQKGEDNEQNEDDEHLVESFTFKVQQKCFAV